MMTMTDDTPTRTEKWYCGWVNNWQCNGNIKCAVISKVIIHSDIRNQHTLDRHIGGKWKSAAVVGIAMEFLRSKCLLRKIEIIDRNMQRKHQSKMIINPIILLLLKTWILNSLSAICIKQCLQTTLPPTTYTYLRVYQLQWFSGNCCVVLPLSMQKIEMLILVRRNCLDFNWIWTDVGLRFALWLPLGQPYGICGIYGQDMVMEWWSNSTSQPAVNLNRQETDKEFVTYWRYIGEATG